MASILVIDDEDLFRSMLKDLLEQENYTVLEAADGAEGLKIFEQERPDLVITDIVMPDTEGMQTIRQIRQTDHKVPIIAISGGGYLGSSDYLTAAEALGAIKSFPKPFDRVEFLDAIKEVLS